MKRIEGLVVVLLFVVTMSAVAQAEEDFGQLCWDANGFFDTLRVWAKRATGEHVMFAIPAAEWDSPGQGGYRLRGHGSASGKFSPTNVLADPTMFVMSLVFDNDSTSFGGNPDCKFRADINPDTLNGSMVARCTGGSGAVFNNTTALTFIDCADVVSAFRSASSSPRLGNK